MFSKLKQSLPEGGMFMRLRKQVNFICIQKPTLQD